MEERTKVPFHGTYRAIGSGGGQAEFLGANNGYTPYNHFGAGDIPIKVADFENATTIGGRTFAHIPIVVGGISIFHSVVIADGLEVALSPCLLAKVFQRNITMWDHEEIINENPTIADQLAGHPINVVVRRLGSSSTSLTTSYLLQACPEVWVIGAGKGGSPDKAPFWPAGVNVAEGSDGIAGFLNTNPYSIGYVDSGHGHKIGLNEVALLNRYGQILKADQADLGAAAVDPSAGVPFAMTDSWSSVNLIDTQAENAWPIVTFSYVYVDSDLSSFGQSGALLKALLEFLLSDECQGTGSDDGHMAEFGFKPLPAELRARAQAFVSNLTLHAAANPFTFETATQYEAGAGEYVISTKRSRWTSYILDGLTDSIDGIEEDTLGSRVSALEGYHDAEEAEGDSIQLLIGSRILTLESSVSELNNTVAVQASVPANPPSDISGADLGSSLSSGDSDVKQGEVDTALTLAIIGLIITAVALVIVIPKARKWDNNLSSPKRPGDEYSNPTFDVPQQSSV